MAESSVPTITGGTLNASLLQPHLAAEVGKGAASPVTQMQQFQTLQHGVLQNRLLGQQVQSKEALGRAVTAATDPQTGETDWNKALGLMSQDPRGAFGVPELAGQVLDRRLKELNLAKEDLAVAGQRWEKVGDVSGSLLTAAPGTLTRDKVIKTLGDQLIGSGMFNNPDSVKQITSFVATLPDDDKGIRQALQGVFLQSKMTTDRVAMLLGSITPVDTGAETVLTQASPLTAETRTAGVIPKGLPPTTQVYNPKTKRMEFVGAGGAGEAGGGAGLAAGPALGEREAETLKAQRSTEQAAALQQRFEVVPRRKAALAEMGQLVEDFRPGPKADLDRVISGLAAQYGVKTQGSTKGMAAYDTFNKLAAEVALAQWGALGGTGSNQQLEQSTRANPNATMSREGIKNVVALLQGNEDAIGAQYQAWKRYEAKNGPGSYGEFLAGWNRYYDPRAFQYLHMDPASAKLMEGRMGEKERAQFARAKAFAKAALGMQ